MDKNPLFDQLVPEYKKRIIITVLMISWQILTSVLSSPVCVTMESVVTLLEVLLASVLQA